LSENVFCKTSGLSSFLKLFLWVRVWSVFMNVPFYLRGRVFCCCYTECIVNVTLFVLVDNIVQDYSLTDFCLFNHLCKSHFVLSKYNYRFTYYFFQSYKFLFHIFWNPIIFGGMFSFLLCIYLGVELLGQMVTVCSIFWRGHCSSLI
jgi:hypothetical protein